jgi:hypothetical protein
MSTQVTLTLPDSVYKQVEAAARRMQRPVADVLTDAVTHAFPTVYVSPDRERMEQEQQAYERQREKLIAEYEGEYIAMHGGLVVDHDQDQTALVRRIDAQYALDEVVHIRLVTRAPDRELRIYSLRFVD